MAELRRPLLLKGSILDTPDISGYTESGVYNLRNSGGVYAGILIVVEYGNTTTQIVFALDAALGSVRKVRHTDLWTTNYLDWHNF